MSSRRFPLPVQGSEARCFRGCIQPHRRRVCGNTATEGGEDLAFIIGNLAAVGTPEGQYNGKTVNGWYWDKPHSRYNAQTNSQPYDGRETENVYLIAA